MSDSGDVPAPTPPFRTLTTLGGPLAGAVGAALMAAAGWEADASLAVFVTVWVVVWWIFVTLLPALQISSRTVAFWFNITRALN